MKKSKKITKRMLMNCYDRETHEMCKTTSRNSAFRWLRRVNRFLTKVVGIDKRIANEKLAREFGW